MASRSGVRGFLRRRLLAPAILGASLTLSFTSPLHASDHTFVVNSAADDGSAGTLRWAIDQANAAGSGTQTISIQLSGNQSIALGSDLPMLNNSAGSIAIENNNPQLVTIDGQDSHSVFFVAAGNVSISNLAIINGASQGGTGGVGMGGGGGALGAGGALFVNVGASVVVEDVQFDGNSATGGTGGDNDGNLAGGGGGAGFTSTGGAATGGGGGGGGGGFAGAGGNGATGGGGGGGIVGAGGAGDNGGGGGGGLTTGSAATDDGGDGNSGALGGNVGTPSNTSATAGDGGDGQSPVTGGGGGGGEGGTNTSTGSAGNGGTGGTGGLGGGGGGGGAGGTSTTNPSLDGNGGHGGDGGTYGGGGGAGNSASGLPHAGDGGDFGGGGGAASVQFEQQFSPGGGEGGFGGGGGGASDAINASGGGSSFGGGHGGNRFQGGSGGSGYGGAIFVRQGGLLTVIGSTTANSAVNPGVAGGGNEHGHAGQAAGQDLYLMSGVNVTFDQAGSSFSGSISGQGGVIVQGQGTTAFGGANNYTGGTTIGGTASLQGSTTSIQGPITNNSNLTFDQNFDGTYTGNMSGTGSLYLSGTGTVELTGITNLGGTTNVQSGGLAMNGVLTSDTIVDAGASLSGNGTIVGDVTVNGEMSPGNSIDTFIVNGGYTQNAGSTLNIEISDAGTTPGVHNDLLSVDATTLNGGTVVVDAAAGTYSANPYRFLRSVTAIQGTFDSVTSNLSDYHVVLGYDYFDSYYWAYLTLEPTVPNYAQFAATSNERAVANYLDSIYDDPDSDLQAMFDGLNTLYGNDAEMQAAFNAMSDQVSPTMAQVGIQNTTLVVQQLAGQLRAGNFLADGRYAAATPVNGSRSPISLVSYDKRSAAPQVTFVSQEDCDTWRGWSFGYGLGGSAQTDGNAAGLNYGMGGMLLGAEKYFEEAGRVGFYGGYQGTSLQLDGLTQNGRINGGVLGGYLYNDDGFNYYTVITGLQFNGYDTTRSIQFDGISERAQGSFSGWQGYAYAERGVSFRSANVTLQPYAALQYIYLRQNGYTETGAGVLNLDVGGIDANSLRSLVGSRLQYDRGWRGGRLLPEVRALWLHEFLDTDSFVNSFFAPIGGGSFAIQGLNLGRDWAILGGGVRYDLASGWQLYGNYDAQVNTQQVFHVGSGGLTYAW